jgi:hypothetical protein
LFHGLDEVLQQDGSVEPGTKSSMAEFVVAEVEQGFAVRFKHVEARDPGRVRENGLQNSQLPQNMHAGWLEQETSTYSLAIGSPFEEHCLMTLPAEQDRCRRTGSSAANDGDAEWLRFHGGW